ncbi:MAG: glycosyltransferase family 9 protein [Chloroflexota bacterium]
MARDWREVRNLLVVRLDNLGDVLVTTPAIHALRENLPEARITLMASQVGAQVAELNHDIDDVIIYEAPWMDVARTLPQDSGREQAMIRLVKDRGFDGSIIFTSYHQSSLPAAYLSYLADIPLRHAASIDFPGTLLTSRHRHPEGIVHEVERGLNLVAGIGFASKQKDMILHVPPQATTEMRSLLAREGVTFQRPLVVVHPGCSCQARTYPAEGYTEVADLLVEALGAQVVFTGLPTEMGLIGDIQRRMKHHAYSIAGRTSFKQLAAVIGLADLIITNNTGPMHVGSCLKTPVVVLFALTNPPEQWGPWQVPHRVLNHPTDCATPCYKFVCPTDHACLAKVSPETVVAAVEELLRESPRGAVHQCA